MLSLSFHMTSRGWRACGIGLLLLVLACGVTWISIDEPQIARLAQSTPPVRHSGARKPHSASSARALHSLAVTPPVSGLVRAARGAPISAADVCTVDARGGAVKFLRCVVSDAAGSF